MTHPAEHLELLPDVNAAYRQLLADGFDTEEYIAGWSLILVRLREHLSSYRFELTLHATEKLGTARIAAYFDESATDGARAAAESGSRRAESEANSTCQWCGRTGYRRSDPLLTVACDGCWPLLVAAWEDRHAPVS